MTGHGLFFVFSLFLRNNKHFRCKLKRQTAVKELGTCSTCNVKRCAQKSFTYFSRFVPAVSHDPYFLRLFLNSAGWAFGGRWSSFRFGQSLQELD
jgi:hypothetical protein